MCIDKDVVFASVPRWVATAMLGLAGLAAQAGSMAEQSHGVRCSSTNVVIHTSQPADIPLACEGARRTIVFLAEQGLDVSGPVTVQMVNKLPPVVDDSAVGCYLPSANRVEALVYSEFIKREGWFGLPASHDLYLGLVSHEVAHAVTACNFKLLKPSIPAYEYVAYVTMLSTMDPALRERVLANFPGTGFDNDRQMNSTIYQFAPMRFGAEAYRHFLRPGNGREYLHRVLAGKALVE